MAFERINLDKGEYSLPPETCTRLKQFPVLAFGKWEETQVDISLHLGSEPETKRFALPPEVRGEYLKDWWKKLWPYRDSLQAIKQLPEPERKEARCQIKPFPGLVLTALSLRADEERFVIDAGLGSYGQVSIVLRPEFQESFPQHRPVFNSLPQGLGINNLVKSSDNYFIFGQRAKDVLTPGVISPISATPNVTGQEIKDHLKGQKLIGSWLFSLVKQDLAEKDELNLLDPTVIKETLITGAFLDRTLNWVTLSFYTALDLSSQEIERSFSYEGNEHTKIIFVKNNPSSLSYLLSQPHLYPGTVRSLQLFLKDTAIFIECCEGY